MIEIEDVGADEEAERIRVVTLARPERRNALTPEGLAALERAVTDADAPVTYLQGSGSAFCAGADLDVVASLSRAEAEDFAALGQRVADAIENSESVVVAGIDGPVRGGGVELALACDLRVATPEATFAEPGVRLGIFGAWGGTVRLPEIVGQGHALDLALSGRVIDAEEALGMGLVSRVVDDPRVVAGELASNDPDALRIVKERVRDRDGFDSRMEREQVAFGELVEQNGSKIR